MRDISFCERYLSLRKQNVTLLIIRGLLFYTAFTPRITPSFVLVTPSFTPKFLLRLSKFSVENVAKMLKTKLFRSYAKRFRS